MNLNEASKAGLIEPLAAVLFRGLAVVIVLHAFRAALDEFARNFFTLPASAGVFFYFWMVLIYFLIPLPIALILFVFSLRLARLTSVSLSRALESKPQP